MIPVIRGVLHNFQIILACNANPFKKRFHMLCNVPVQICFIEYQLQVDFYFLFSHCVCNNC